MEIVHIAHSARCALLLDDGGVCRWFVLKVDDDEAVLAAAKRCVGAQFVATLDPDAPGLLGHEPKVGANLLLARVDDGRVSLVRFGPLSAFETLDEPAEPEKTAAEPETTRRSLPADLPADESDVTLQRHAPQDEDESDEDDTQIASTPRISGFAIRVVPPVEDPELATHRFEREREPPSEAESARPSEPKRRGVLPRRRSG